MNATKETICTRCEHRKVCRHSENLLALIGKVDLLDAASFGPFAAEVHCHFHKRAVPNPREAS